MDYLSQKKPQKSIDILNELIFKGGKNPAILSMIQRQFKLLFNIKLAISDGKNKESIASELKLHPFICEKMIQQSRKFTLEQLVRSLEFCLKAEKTLKSSSADEKLELEMLIINSIKM